MFATAAVERDVRGDALGVGVVVRLNSVFTGCNVCILVFCKAFWCVSSEAIFARRHCGCCLVLKRSTGRNLLLLELHLVAA